MSTTYGGDPKANRRVNPARIQLFEEILLGCVSGTTQTPEINSQFVRPK